MLIDYQRDYDAMMAWVNPPCQHSWVSLDHGKAGLCAKCGDIGHKPFKELRAEELMAQPDQQH